MPLDNITLPPITPLMEPGATSRIIFPVVERKMQWLTQAGQGVDASGSKALVRMTTDKSPVLLSVVNSTYKLATNKELFTTIEQTIIDKVEPSCLVGVQLKDHISYDGRVCYREYVFPNLRCDIGAKSDIGFRIVVSNSYGGGAIKLLAGAIEFFCTNGMVSGQYESTYARHTSGLVMSTFASNITSALDRFVSDAQRWRKWVETPVEFISAMVLLKNIASSPRMAEALSIQCAREFDVRGPNLWSVYSAMTYYASHNDGNFATRSDSEDESSGAATSMFKRELTVRDWTNTKEFKQLENV